MLKSSLILSVAFIGAFSMYAQASDFQSLPAPAASPTVTAHAPANIMPSTVTAAPTPMTANTTTMTKTTTTTMNKPGMFKNGVNVIPDTSGNTPPVVGQAKPKADQGYSKASAYNVVNDQNKPVTQDWTKPKSWRIGYKNKNRTGANE